MYEININGLLMDAVCAQGWSLLPPGGSLHPLHTHPTYTQTHTPFTTPYQQHHPLRLPPSCHCHSAILISVSTLLTVTTILPTHPHLTFYILYFTIRYDKPLIMLLYQFHIKSTKCVNCHLYKQILYVLIVISYNK